MKGKVIRKPIFAMEFHLIGWDVQNRKVGSKKQNNTQTSMYV